jgi:hypothetical protein
MRLTWVADDHVPWDVLRSYCRAPFEVDRRRLGLGDMSYARIFEIGRPVAIGAAALFTHFLILAVGTVLPSAIAAAEPKCADMILSVNELDDVLDQTLGSFRDLVDHRSVSIDPSSNSCYLRISLATSALSQFGAECRLEGCSAVLHRQKSLALRAFDVAGCDTLFNGLGLSRRVPSTYVDASARIRKQCGSDDFAIDSVTVVQIAGEPKLRFGFRSTPARN